jgi:hypothetical protein
MERTTDQRMIASLLTQTLAEFEKTRPKEKNTTQPGPPINGAQTNPTRPDPTLSVQVKNLFCKYKNYFYAGLH